MKEVAIGGVRFQVGAMEPAFWDHLGAGQWEAGTFRAIAAHLTAETIFLDFGAWIGPVTLFAASLARQVLAFEPDPVAAAHLKTNIALNPALAPKITVFERAVWPEPGLLTLGAKTAQGDSMSSVHHKGSHVSWQVDAITPREIAALLPAEAPVFLKIDVEGAEYAIVPALAGLIARRHVVALVSFHPRFAAGGHPRWHKTFAMTAQVMRGFRGFRVYRVHKASFRRALGAEALLRLGLPYFEARTSYLFVR